MKQSHLTTRAEIAPRRRQMVGVDRETLDPGLLTSRHCPLHQRAVKQRHQRFGQAIRERAQAIAESGTEDESLIHAASFDAQRGKFQV